MWGGYLRDPKSGWVAQHTIIVVVLNNDECHTPSPTQPTNNSLKTAEMPPVSF